MQPGVPFLEFSAIYQFRNLALLCIERIDVVLLHCFLHGDIGGLLHRLGFKFVPEKVNAGEDD